MGILYVHVCMYMYLTIYLSIYIYIYTCLYLKLAYLCPDFSQRCIMIASPRESLLSNWFRWNSWLISPHGRNHAGVGLQLLLPGETYEVSRNII